LSPPDGTAARCQRRCMAAPCHSGMHARIVRSSDETDQLCTQCHPRGRHDLPRACAVLCCAAFKISGTNSNDCLPVAGSLPPYSRLMTEAACRSLAAIAAIADEDVYAGSENYSYYPAGCFRHTVSGKFYWNTHESGANNSFAQPLCAGAPHARTDAKLDSGLRREQVVVRACLVIWYSGTQGSFTTRVFRHQAVLGYSVIWAVLSYLVVLGYSVLRKTSSTQAIRRYSQVLRYSEIRQYSGAQGSGGAGYSVLRCYSGTQ
jgi:hypothetical protein